MNTITLLGGDIQILEYCREVGKKESILIFLIEYPAYRLP